MRPRSFLLSPALKLARETALSQYNVRSLNTTQEDFAADVLAQLTAAAELGQQVIATAARVDSGAEILADVADEMDDSVDDEREFLMGREPRWSDLTGGYAIEREFDRSLSARIADAQGRLVLLTGTAGSGKSTSAMRLALEYQGEGRRVYALNPMGSARFHRIRNSIRTSHAQVLLIDDADRFGSSTAALLKEIVDDNPELLVIAVMRSSRAEYLGVDAQLAGTPGLVEFTEPLLEDSDIDGLLDALTAAKRLGKLREKSRSDQRACSRRTMIGNCSLP